MLARLYFAMSAGRLINSISGSGNHTSKGVSLTASSDSSRRGKQKLVVMSSGYVIGKVVSSGRVWTD